MLYIPLKFVRYLFLEQLCTLGKSQGKVNDHISYWLCSNGSLFGQTLARWNIGLSWYNHPSTQACNVSHASLCSSQSMLLFLLQFLLRGPNVFNNVLSRWCLLTAAKNFQTVGAEVKCFMKYFAIYGYIGQCKQPFMLTKPSILKVFFFPQRITQYS